MKRMFAILTMALCTASCSVMLQGSREGITVGGAVNISAQPPWGPAGYACAPYYYFPDFNIYYDVNRALFYYLDHGRWRSAHRLPPYAGPRDLYKFYKVVLDVRDPWLYSRSHRIKYKKYRGIHTQPVLRDTPRYKYRPQPERGPHGPERGPADTPYRGNRNPARDMRNNYTRPDDAGQGSRRGNIMPPQQQKRQKASPRTPQKRQPARNSDSGKASGKRSAGSRGR